MTKGLSLWLFVIILIALALRLAWLGEQSLWYDEGVTWLLSQMSPFELIRWTAADIQPPLYYLLEWAASHLFGQSEWALRFPAAICGVLTIPLIYILASRLFPAASPPRLTSILAAGLLAISPVMVYYGQEARMYTLLVFEATLAGYLLLKVLQPPLSEKPNLSALFTLQPAPFYYALTITAALYTHYFAVFLLAAHGLYFLFIFWQRNFPKSLGFQALQISGIIILLFAPWVSVLFARWGDDPSYWPGALKLHETLRKVFINFTVGETVFEQTGFHLTLGYLLLLLICAAYGRLSQSIRQPTANPNTLKPESKNLTTESTKKTQTRSAQRLFVCSVKFFRDLYVKNFLLKKQASRCLGTKSSSLFLALWLLLPITLILAFSYQSPKFNPRYTLLSWPAFALILAASVTKLRESPLAPNHRHKTSSPPSPPPPPPPPPPRPPAPGRVPRTPGLGRFFILAASAFSLYNWFTDPRFAKDDFQALAQFVRERIGPDETVLLSSGHMFPVWAYYYGWQGWTPLPRLERLDINRVTDLGISQDIASALQGKGGVWLVGWQDEVIDPNGVVPFWLDVIGRRPHDAGDFQGVRLEHWRLDRSKMGLLYKSPIERPAVPATNSETPAITSSYYNFADQVDLLGMTQLNDTELALFWRPRRLLPDNLLLTLGLSDQDGFKWDQVAFVGRPGAYLYPPSRWPVGEIVMTRQPLAWQTGTPPGLYLAEIGLGQPIGDVSSDNLSGHNFNGWDVLDEQGRPLRPTALIDFVNLSRLVQPIHSPLAWPETPLVDFRPIIMLRQSQLSPTTAEPGDRLLLALLWQAGEFNLDDISVAFDLLDAQGHSFRVGSSPTPSRNFNLPHWQPGNVVKGQYWLDIPPETAPGPATLQVRLINEHGSRYDELFPFEKLGIRPTERNFTPPASVDIPLEADFSGQVTLIGADCRPATRPTDAPTTPPPTGVAAPGPTTNSECRARPGQSVTLTFYWRAESRLDANYTVFTHLLGPAETVVANADHTPPKPTQGWVSGEIIADTVTLTVPANQSPGDYPIEVGLYNAAIPDFPRLPLASGEMQVILPQPLKVE